MKKFCIFSLILSVFLITGTTGVAYAQIEMNLPQTEKVLCYKTTTKEVQKLTSGIEFEKLATHELLKSKIITYKKAFRLELTDQDVFIKKHRYEYHHNLYPSWYFPPDEIVADDKGYQHIYTQKNSMFDGGWFAHNYTSARPGSYTSTDLRFGVNRNIYHIDYDSEGYEHYTKVLENVKSFGILYSFKLAIPTNEQLMQYENQGYTVMVNDSWIKIFNRNVTITYYLVENRVEYEFYEDYKLIYKITRYYEWVTEVSDVVIVKEIEITPYTLTTGDCAETERITVYSDYQFNCGELDDEESSAELRSVAEKSESTLLVYPNPASDFINLQFKKSLQENDVVEISVYNQLESLVFSQKTNGQIPSGINTQLLTSGAYYVSIQVNNDFYSTKFIKN